MESLGNNIKPGSLNPINASRIIPISIKLQAIEYAKKLFKCNFANVQPHCGSSANMAVYKALLNIGDKVMGMNLDNGGHLTHGHRLSFSGIDYEIVSYDDLARDVGLPIEDVNKGPSLSKKKKQK